MPPKKNTKSAPKKPKKVQKVSPERMKTRLETIRKMEKELQDREIAYQEDHINRLQAILDEKRRVYKI